MNFVLFLLLNVVLLLRPDDLFPEQFAGLRVYLVVILLCVLFSAPQILAQLSPGALADRPITVGVLGFYGASLLSLAVKGWLGVAMDWAGEFGKVVLYYLLFVAVVNTPSRFRVYLGFLVAVIVILAILTLLQFNDIIYIEALKFIGQGVVDMDTGLASDGQRLRAHGLFSDPNDYCLILSTGIFCCLARRAIALDVFHGAVRRADHL